MIEGLYGLMTIVGPVLLLAVLAWAMLNNRTSRRQKQETEEATRRLYKEQGKADRARDAGSEP